MRQQPYENTRQIKQHENVAEGHERQVNMEKVKNYAIN